MDTNAMNSLWDITYSNNNNNTEKEDFNTIGCKQPKLKTSAHHNYIHQTSRTSEVLK